MRNSWDCPGRTSACSGKTAKGFFSAAAAALAASAVVLSAACEGSCPPQNTVIFARLLFVTVTVLVSTARFREHAPKSTSRTSSDTARHGSGSKSDANASALFIAPARDIAISSSKGSRSDAIGGCPGSKSPTAHRALYDSTCDRYMGAGRRLSS